MDIKCSVKKHSEINAVCYCYYCKKNLCNKCQNIHLEFFEEHKLVNIDKNTNYENLFTGYCKEKNHSNKLEYFCKDHNKLCCVECICKIKDEINGHHSDCNITKIENISEEKKKNLKDNIKCLEELNNTLENSINDLKKIMERKEEEKEKSKLEIQNIFTKIRTALNDKEDKLLIEIDKKFQNVLINDEIIKESKNFFNKVKISIDKGKIIEKEWNINPLSSIINDCINIENNINEIHKINDIIKKYDSNDTKDIKFSISEIDINNVLSSIKEIELNNSTNIKWKTGPNYILSNDDLIATKNSGGYKYNCNILGNILPKNRINKWKIKLKKFNKNNFYDWNVLIGVAPSNINPNEENLYQKTWTLICGSLNVSIKNGSQTNYKNNKDILKEGDIVEVIMNTITGELSFSVNGENLGVACKIPLDIDLSPFALIKHEGDSLEILNE